MTNSTNTQLSIVDELRSQLTSVKDRIKEEGVSKVVFDELTSSAKLLQNKLDELLAKGGVITQSDINDAYDVIKQAKRKELDNIDKKVRKKTIVYIGLGVLAIALLVMYGKKK
jgi:hypothetical protein